MSLKLAAFSSDPFDRPKESKNQDNLRCCLSADRRLISYMDTPYHDLNAIRSAVSEEYPHVFASSFIVIPCR